VEYAGSLGACKKKLKKLIQLYSDQQAGSFIFEFRRGTTNYWIDATKESEKYGMGRLINHDWDQRNIFARIEMVGNGGMAGGRKKLQKIPRLLFYDGRDIYPDEEPLYRYGDTSADRPLWMGGPARAS